MNRKTQRLYAGLCLAICGGFLIGTLRERFTAKPMSLPATPAPTPAEADALQQALGSYRAALTETTSDTERIAVAQKLSDLGLAAHHRDKGRGSIAIAAFEEAEAAFRSAKAWKRLALTNAIHAEALLLRGRTEEAIALWRETSAIVPRVSEADFAPTIQLQAGEFFLDRGRLFDARAVLTAAQSAFAAQNDRKGVAHCRRYLGGAALEEGDVQTARRELSASLQALTALKDEPTIAAVQGTLGDVALREGDWSEAERRYASGSELLAKIGQDFWNARFLARQSALSLAQNRTDEAETLATESVRLLEASGGSITRAYPLMALGDVARRRGDQATARRYHAEALALWKRLGNPYRIRAAQEALLTDG